MANFWLVFSAKKNKTLKSDKLALIEAKILNLMFLDIYIPVVPIENWLRTTHNQRQKLSRSLQSYYSAMTLLSDLTAFSCRHFRRVATFR